MFNGENTSMTDFSFVLELSYPPFVVLACRWGALSNQSCMIIRILMDN
jgi:hypothetical protein